jgi:hypothetical protein
MSRQSLHELQSALLDLLAPPNWREMGITRATLDLSGGGLPQLTLVTEVRPDGDPLAWTQAAQRFELHPLDPPALDLDRMAGEAMARVTRQIDSMAAGQLAKLRDDVTAARARASDRMCWAFPEIHIRCEAERANKAFMAAWSRNHEAIMRMTDAYLDQFYTRPVESRQARWRRQGRAWFRGLRTGELAATWCSVIGIAFVLGGCGRWLDEADHERAQATAQQVQQEAEERELAAAWDRQVRQLCAAIGGDNTGYLTTQHDGIVCTDKRGRKIGKVSL